MTIAAPRKYVLELRGRAVRMYRTTEPKPQIKKLDLGVHPDALRGWIRQAETDAGYVQERLSGQVRRADGTAVAGPAAAEWKGRNKPRRQDRRWATAWSPGQISNRLRVDFPDDDSMRISRGAIYQALFIQGRGALPRELVAFLPTTGNSGVGASFQSVNFPTKYIRHHNFTACMAGNGGSIRRL